MTDTTSTTSNGATDKAATLTTITPTGDSEREPYRPTASIVRVQQAILRGLCDIAHDAALEACHFMSMAQHYDKDEPMRVRYGHLVDASECLEIAMTHLGRLQDDVFHRMVISGENVDELIDNGHRPNAD